MTGDDISRFVIRCVPGHVFEIKPIQVGEPAVPAPYRYSAAADRQIVKSVDTAVPAHGLRRKRPDRPVPGFCKNTLFVHVFIEGYKDPGGTAVSTGNISPVGHNMNMLVCHLPAVVTIGAVIRADEFVVHAGVLCIRGIINLSQLDRGGAGRSRVYAGGIMYG